MAVHQIEIETKIKRKIHLKCSSTQLRTSLLPLLHPMGCGVASLFIAPFIHYHSNRSQRTVSAKNKKPLNSPLHGASASARADGMHAETKKKKKIINFKFIYCKSFFDNSIFISDGRR